MASASILAAVATPAQAQVRGRVVDASDRPVPDALVEIWASSRPVAAADTDERGTFHLPAGPAEEGWMLTVRRPGMRTETVRLAPGDSLLVVRMQARPVALAPVTVQGMSRPRCPNREDPRARALWERMRARYWRPGDDTVHVFAFLEQRSGTGERADAADPAAGRTSAGWTTGALVLAHPEFMALSGYATSAAGGVGDRTAFWSYRALDGGTMQDFTGDHFGAAHTFSIVPHGDGAAAVAFCPRGRMGRTGRIEGTLVLAADTTLLRAEWSFRTPRPEEDAGGAATYDPPDPALGNALLSSESVFWRRTTPPRYYFEAKAFTGWQRWTLDRPVTHPDQARPAPSDPTPPF